MKFYSEKLNKLFDTDNELVAAELEAEKAEQAKEETKKSLADKIATTESNLAEAYQYYATVRQEAEEIAKQTNSQIAKMLQEAKDIVLAAEKQRTDAIVEFNSKFGTYKAVYSGERAVQEAERLQLLFKSIFGNW